MTGIDMSSFRTYGIGVAPVTPFKQNGDLNLSAYDAMVTYLKKTKVEHVFGRYTPVHNIVHGELWKWIHM
ncbi:hypothetical protein ScPMuIL_014453 [Solemya velum]